VGAGNHGESPAAPEATGRVLVVEDNAALRLGIWHALHERYAVLDLEAGGRKAVERLRDPGVEPYDVVITDLRLPGEPGLEVLRAALERSPSTAVVMMTAYASVETAVEAMRLGAHDFLQKPFDLGQLELRVARALAHARLVGEVTELRRERAGHAELLGASPALEGAVAMADRIAATRSTVLVTGETGTGKELIAAAIHRRSPRAEQRLVKVNCAALPETLLESELFGHERGAFTGAEQRRVGRFEEADRGTLFLDEVADMSAVTQAKLLRVLQDGEFQRLGASTNLRVDVRIIAATNRDLEVAMREGSFREDLYFRLNVIRVHMPPLRERGDDIATLARHFVAEFGRELGRGPLGLAEEALERLRAHAWPGNVRELRNVIERAVLLADGSRVEAVDVGLGEAARPAVWEPALPPGGLSLAEVEREVVLEALRRSGFVQKDAAALLGISRRKLNYKIQRMGITHESWRRNRAAGDSCT